MTFLGLPDPAVELEAWAIRSRRAIERDGRFHLLDGASERIPIGRDAEESAAADFEALPCSLRPARLLEALLQIRKGNFVEIAAGDDAVQAHAVADLARNLQHMFLNRSDQYGNVRIGNRRRCEIRRHQREVVMLALEVQWIARLPRMPAGAHRAH